MPGFVFQVGKLFDVAGEFAQLAEGFNNGQCGLGGYIAFENGGQHVEAFFAEGLGVDGGVFERMKPVEIFHQFGFFLFRQFKEIASREFFRVVGD